jgi:hypothetical protein
MRDLYIISPGTRRVACRLRIEASLCKRVTVNCSKNFEVPGMVKLLCCHIGRTRLGMLGDLSHFSSRELVGRT